MAKKAAAAAKVDSSAGAIVGAAEVVDLSTLAPNNWNPNRLTTHQFESLKFGLFHDGWIASQALLVWDRGKDRIIIDGEHRWKAAREIGMTHAPAVLLKDLRRAEAVALTIKLDQKRGSFDQKSLAAALREVRTELGLEGQDMALDLGFEDDVLGRLLAEPVVGDLASRVSPHDPPGTPVPAAPPGRTEVKGVLPNLRVPVVFYFEAPRAEFLKRVFENSASRYELNGALLDSMVEAYLESHPEARPT